MNSLPSIHWFDLVIIAVLIAGASIGARSGIKRFLLRLVSYVVSTYVTIYWHHPLRDLLAARLKEVHPVVPVVFSYVLTFLGAYLLLWLGMRLAKRLLIRAGLLPTDHQLDEAMTAVDLQSLNRVLGAGFGLAVAAIVVCLGVILISFLAQSESGNPVQQSTLGPLVLDMANDVIEAIPQAHKDNLSRSLEDLKRALADKLGDESGRQLNGLSGKVDAIPSIRGNPDGHQHGTPVTPSW